MNGIELEILWGNLISTVTEQARALQRIAFSPVVREAGDLANALFDQRGRMVAQGITGTPGHINSLAIAGRHLFDIFPLESLHEGDVLITNDPWRSAGHFFDITVLTPVFLDGRAIGAYGSTIHHTDIGGLGIGAGGRDVHEEGLWIPPLKLRERGEPNAVLHAIIGANVRTPDHVFGDLSAQISSNMAGARRLITLCQRHGLADIEELSDEICTRSEQATRDAIRALPAGTYHGESRFDVPGGEIITLKAAVTIDNQAGEILVDFAGSSGPSAVGINVVLNYTHAYTSFAIRSCLNPDLPNNHGSLAPIKVAAPEGCILNCRYPAPVNARHVVGMQVPMPILKALHKVLPGRVLAEGAGAVWTVQVQGEKADGQPFTSAMFNYSGGMGARETKPGPSATCYPTGVGAVPVEVLEATVPIVFLRKELRAGSGGAGRTEGGEGQ
ncbi:MAG TPA: hydantoinase B/oxoprolinase family protein, partial [Stellaceae bacterium]|nr:hydantoinase B/oxoprolinase family protein [Stellaceae bacterium]